MNADTKQDTKKDDFHRELGNGSSTLGFFNFNNGHMLDPFQQCSNCSYERNRKHMKQSLVWLIVTINTKNDKFIHLMLKIRSGNSCQKNYLHFLKIIMLLEVQTH